MKLGLYLAGCGSLDGSDIPTAVLARELLQADGHDVLVGARDISQATVINHRTLEQEEASRNSLDESARVARGAIDDLKDIDRGELEGLVLVGGGGVLSTWTDFDERGAELRITERLKFHLESVHGNGGPIVCLGNAHLPVAFVLREQGPVRFHRGSNRSVRELVDSWNHVLTESNPTIDRSHSVAHLTGLLNQSDWSKLRSAIRDCFNRIL